MCVHIYIISNINDLSYLISKKYIFFNNYIYLSLEEDIIFN